jgi:hypothetical protein
MNQLACRRHFKRLSFCVSLQEFRKLVGGNSFIVYSCTLEVIFSSGEAYSEFYYYILLAVVQLDGRNLDHSSINYI